MTDLQPSNLQPSIRPMTLDDLPRVVEIDRASFTLPWPANSYRFELTQNNASRCWVTELDGAVVAILVLWLIEDEAHIATIAVHPDYRGQGLGRQILLAALDDAIRHGATAATLEVRASNQAAINLYTQLGFALVGRRPRYYQDTHEDALIMTAEQIRKLMTPTSETLLSKLQTRQARVAILGLGYVGLPLAVVFAEAGFTVVGVDPDKRKVDTINRGESHIQDVPGEKVARLLQAGKLSATTDFAALRQADAVSICVPTPLSKFGDPDMSYVISATEALAAHMHPGMVVVLESTTYPGTTREILLPKLGSEKGLTVGEDFFLAFSPERVDPGREDWTTVNTPKVMGGITEACSQVASAWYGQALKTIVPVATAEAAEMTKLLENTFRMINIGLVNELAMMCERMGVDVWEVINAAATKPFGFMKFTPGPGLGGHCIPIDPLYLSWKLKEINYTARFIELASEINSNMPRYVVGRVMDALNEQGKALKGSNVLVLGAAYKPDIDDVRESPALDVIALLNKKGAAVSYHDPFIPHLHTHDGMVELDSVTDLMAAVRQADCVLIVTNHSQYDYAAILAASKLIFDSRNALGKLGRGNPKVVKL